MAHLWAKWPRHPCRLGDPHRFRAGGKIRSGPFVGKVATSPLLSRGSPPLQSGGENQKCPTYGQSGYVTPAVSGIPTASKRGGKSQVAHLWAKWLRHPCRLGDAHRCRVGGKIRSGPLMGKVATSPLPSRGSPPLHSGGGNQKWPTSGQSGYVTPAVSGIPTASERGAKSEMAHKWAKWLRHPCRLGDPHRSRAGGKIRSGLTCGQSGHVTPAVSGIPSAAERGGKSEVAHLWAKWLRHPCRLGDPHGFRAGRKIRSGPFVGKVATSPVLGDPHRFTASVKIRSGPQVGKLATSPVLGDPHRFRASAKITSGPQVGKVATSPLPSRGSTPVQSGGGKSEVAHLWAKWLRHPCRLRDAHRCTAGGKIGSGSLMGKVATSPLLSRGSPPLQSGGGNQKWPTCGQSGYVTPAVSEIPTASERGENHKWLTYGQSGYITRAVSGIPTASKRGGGIRSGPLVGKVATSPLPCRGSPPLQSGGQNQKWPTCGQSGYITPAVSVIPTALERVGNSKVAHLWAKWLRHPCRLGDPHRFRAGENHKWLTYGQSGYITPAVSGIPTASERGGKSVMAHLRAKWLHHPCRLGDPHRCRAGGKSEPAHLWAKWLRRPCHLGDRHRCRARGGKSEIAQLWAKWPRHPCRLGDLHCCRMGGKIRSGPQVGKVATSPLPSRGSPSLQSGWENHKWLTCGQSGYVTPAVSGIPTAAERGAKSEVAHLWAKWLRHPCRPGHPHRCRAVGKIRSGPQVGKVATSPLPSRGSPPLQSGGENQKWPTCGQSGYATPAVSGIPTASGRVGKSEVAHLWAKSLRHPCCLEDPHRCRAGGKIRSGPLVGKLAT